MTPKILILSIALAATFIIGTHYFAEMHQLKVFALFLALTSCFYGGATLTPSGAKYLKIEMPFVVIVFMSSFLGLILSPVWIAIGFFIHGFWDVLHHFNKVKTPVVKWFPPLCAIFDVLVGIFILAWWF